MGIIIIMMSDIYLIGWGYVLKSFKTIIYISWCIIYIIKFILSCHGFYYNVIIVFNSILCMSLRTVINTLLSFEPKIKIIK